MSKLGDKITLISGQHIVASKINSQSVGVPYLTGPADFIGKKVYATKYTKFPFNAMSVLALSGIKRHWGLQSIVDSQFDTLPC